MSNTQILAPPCKSLQALLSVLPLATAVLAALSQAVEAALVQQVLHHQQAAPVQQVLHHLVLPLTQSSQSALQVPAVLLPLVLVVLVAADRQVLLLLVVNKLKHKAEASSLPLLRLLVHSHRVLPLHRPLLLRPLLLRLLLLLPLLLRVAQQPQLQAQAHLRPRALATAIGYVLLVAHRSKDVLPDHGLRPSLWQLEQPVYLQLIPRTEMLPWCTLVLSAHTLSET